MERLIPFDSNCQLGHAVDFTKFPLKTGKRLIPEDVKPIFAQPNYTTQQFSIIESMKDVSDILGIPPEYALKVQAGIAFNPVVQFCLQDVLKRNVVTAVFRLTYLQQKKVFLFDSKTEGPGVKDDEERNQTQGAGGSDASDSDGYSHVVNAVEIGNELVAILKISSADKENFYKFATYLKEALRSSQGNLNDEVLYRLDKLADSVDKKLSKKHYDDVKCSVHYGSFTDKAYGSSVKGMVTALRGFIEKAVGWADLFKYRPGDVSTIEHGKMLLKEGIQEEKKGFFDNFSVFKKDTPEMSVKYPVGSPPHSDTDVDGGDPDSFVVLASETDKMYYMRLSLMSLSDQLDDSEIESFTSFSLSQYPEASRGRFEQLFIVLMQLEEAIRRLQALFNSKRFLCDDRVIEGNQMLRRIQDIHLEVHEVVNKLDMVTLPSEDFVSNVCSANPLQTVNDYIENVMSKLPPGCDLDLLMIGKTGHGKSSTGNTILGQEKFKASASGESVTKSSSVAWCNVDGRIIKVVDTPGVCDTAEDTNSIDMAIRAMSEAITQCQGGFHALLLVIRFGQRMTNEERKAIGMLKCILGENVIKTHCICIITHGDNFESEIKGEKTFQEWCKDQGGFLKELFTECDFRCVLFNNKATDPKVSKGQLIELIGKVDSLKSSGTRYTNALFEYAQNQRKEIVSEQQVPEVSQDMMRDIELVLDHLKRLAGNTQQIGKYAEELEYLKRMVENLSNRVTEVEGDQVKVLVETVFSLAEVIHGEIDKIADKATPDSPDGATGNSFLGNEPHGEPGSMDVNPNLQAQAENLQKFRDHQVEEQTTKVDPKVADKVAEKIESGQNCFPADSKVRMRDGSVKCLEDLQIGEKVLARSEKGQLDYETVYMFGHRNHDSVIDYIVFQVDGKNVFVSDQHLVFCIRDGVEMCLSAKNVCVGDELLVCDDTPVPNCKPVLKIMVERKRGVFAPFTNGGTIVVNGALMSCYVDVVPHATAHALLSPIRQLYRLSPSLLACINGSNKDREIPSWAKLALKWV